jgi:hypothetical protein
MSAASNIPAHIWDDIARRANIGAFDVAALRQALPAARRAYTSPSGTDQVRESALRVAQQHLAELMNRAPKEGGAFFGRIEAEDGPASWLQGNNNSNDWFVTDGRLFFEWDEARQTLVFVARYDGDAGHVVLADDEDEPAHIRLATRLGAADFTAARKQMQAMRRALDAGRVDIPVVRTSRANTIVQHLADELDAQWRSIEARMHESTMWWQSESDY